VRTRCQLVDVELPVLAEEELHAEDANAFDGFDGSHCQLLCPPAQGFLNWGGCVDDAADVVLLYRLHARVHRKLASTVAGNHDSELLQEWDPALGEQTLLRGALPELYPCAFESFGGLHRAVSVAIVAEESGLEQDWEAYPLGKLPRLHRRGYLLELRHRNASARQMLLLRELIADEGNGFGRRVDGAPLGELAQ
jgi:hypothetical protein